MASSYEISLSPFSDQKTFWNDENATRKKEAQFLCHDCSVNHFTLIQCLWKRGKWPFLNPLQGRNPEKKSSNLWLPTLQLLGSTHSWCFRVQTIFQNATVQTLNNLFGKSGSQEGRGRALAESSFGKEWHALFLCTHLFPCTWNLLKRNVILFPAKSLIQLLGATLTLK